MSNLFSRFSGKAMMVLCIAACAIPFMVILALGGQANLSWLGLLACVGMHVLMFKLMPGHSCHGDKEEKELKPVPQEAPIKIEDRSKAMDA